MWTIFNQSTLGQDLQPVYENYAGLAHSAFAHFCDSPQQLRFDFLNNRQFNAAARHNNDQFQIGVNVAVPTILQFTFNILLLNPDFFPEIGDLGLDQGYDELPNGIPMTLPSDVEINELIHSITGVSRPLCDQRTLTSAIMTKIATSFVIYHEVAHVVLGHVKAFNHNSSLNNTQANNGLLELIEINQINEPIDHNLRQIWEFEADILAAIMVTADLFSPQNIDFISGAFDLKHQETLSYGEIASFALSAIAGLFLLENQHVQKQSTPSHPTPEVRFCAVASEISNHLKQHYPELLGCQDSFDQLLDATMANITDVWQAANLNGSAIIQYQDPQTALQQVIALNETRKQRCHEYRHFALHYPLSRS